MQAYDLEDVRESVRQGVTKVAGKISSLANGVMSSLQVRWSIYLVTYLLYVFLIFSGTLRVLAKERRWNADAVYFVFTY